MLLALAMVVVTAQAPRIHLISDISQEFTFYMDGRFHRQYVGENGVDARNWGTLSKLDLSNTNLLVVAGGDDRVPYSAATNQHILSYVNGGGGLVMMADGGPMNSLAQVFGGGFLDVRAVGDPVGVGALDGKTIELRRGNTLSLNRSWTVLVKDGEGRPLMAKRSMGKGNILLSVRGLFGSNPDASDPINADWIKPLLREIAKGKTVDPSKPHQGQWAEIVRPMGELTLEFTEGTKKFADSIVEEYLVVKKHLIEITGVQPSPGMITKLLLLPTGGGGFSSGERIGIAAWWGDYPKNRYPMIELIGHEAGHSWVLPHPEPVWNEPIATYLGIQVGKRLGMPEAQQTLENQIARARQLDPDLNKIDIGKPDAPRDAVWGKTYYIFEQLDSKYGNAIEKYFKAKRRLVTSGRQKYTLDDAVGVLSNGMGEDLFPWFKSLGIDVDASRTDLKPPR